MKRILPLIALLFLAGCGGEEPSYFGPNSADSLMENLGNDILMAETSYDSYINSQSTKAGDPIMYSVMMQSFERSLKDIKEVNDYSDAEKYIQPNDAHKLKATGVKIIETYIDVAKTELKQVKDENLRWESERCQWFYEGGNIRIQEAYDAYGKIQKKIAHEHGITLY